MQTETFFFLPAQICRTCSYFSGGLDLASLFYLVNMINFKCIMLQASNNCVKDSFNFKKKNLKVYVYPVQIDTLLIKLPSQPFWA